MNHINIAFKICLFTFAIFFIHLFKYNILLANENNRFPVYVSKKGGYINQSGRIEILPQYNYVGSFSEGVAAVKKDGEHHIINTSGVVVASPNIEHYILGIKEFKNGLACVSLRSGEIFIDKEGNQVFETIYEDARAFNNGLAAVKIEGKWGFINNQGRLKINNDFDYVESFLNEFAPVRVEKKWGIINKAGEFQTKPNFTFIWGSSEIPFLSAVDGNFIYIDQYGNEKLSISVERCSPFNEGLAIIYRENKAGFIDKEGNIVIPCRFDNAHPFSEDMAGIQEDEKWGFINKTGEVIVQPRFHDVGPFQNGLARVWIYGEDQNVFGYVNENGIIVWEPSI